MISKDVIVVIRSSAIGDVVLSSALLDYLDALDRDIKVVWLGSQPSLSLVSSHPRMEAAIPVTSGDLFERMANYRDRVLSVVDLQANLRSIRLANSLSKFFRAKYLDGKKIHSNALSWLLKLDFVLGLVSIHIMTMNLSIYQCYLVSRGH